MSQLVLMGSRGCGDLRDPKPHTLPLSHHTLNFLGLGKLLNVIDGDPGLAGALLAFCLRPEVPSEGAVIALQIRPHVLRF